MNSASGGDGCSAAAGEGPAAGSAGGGQVGEERSKFIPAYQAQFHQASTDSCLILFTENREETKGKSVGMRIPTLPVQTGCMEVQLGINFFI